MSVYHRYKKNLEGLYRLVELLESTPQSRRQKMIAAGMLEDRDYTRRALSLCLSFEDIRVLPDLELAEILSDAPSRIVGAAISELTPTEKMRILRISPKQKIIEIRDYSESHFDPVDVEAAQIRMIQAARSCEKKGRIRLRKWVPQVA